MHVVLRITSRSLWWVPCWWWPRAGAHHAMCRTRGWSRTGAQNSTRRRPRPRRRPRARCPSHRRIRSGHFQHCSSNNILEQENSLLAKVFFNTLAKHNQCLTIWHNSKFYSWYGKTSSHMIREESGSQFIWFSNNLEALCFYLWFEDKYPLPWYFISLRREVIEVILVKKARKPGVNFPTTILGEFTILVSREQKSFFASFFPKQTKLQLHLNQPSHFHMPIYRFLLSSFCLV